MDILVVGDKALFDKYGGDEGLAGGEFNNLVGAAQTFFADEFNLILYFDFWFTEDDLGSSADDMLYNFNRYMLDRDRACITRQHDIWTLWTGHNLSPNGRSNGVNPCNQGSFYVTDENKKERTFIHELIHNLGVGHIQCGDDTPCQQECYPDPVTQQVKLMCCCSGGCIETETLELPSCVRQTVETNLQTWCNCIRETAEIDEECSVCFPKLNIENLTPGAKIPNCEGKDEIEYEVLLCNDCGETDAITRFELTFVAGTQRIISTTPPNMLVPGTGPNPQLEYFNLNPSITSLKSGECLRFRVQAEPMGHSISVITTRVEAEMSDFGGKIVRDDVGVNVYSNFFEITGDRFLSELINDNPFSPVQIPICSPQTGDARFIKIDGTLTIDIPYYCFNGVFFNLTEGSEIIIGSNFGSGVAPSTLQFQNSALVGCDGMWQSITVENSTLLFMENTIISDAIAAIKPQNNSQIKLDNNQFINNFFGIHIDNSLTNITSFNNNVFSASSLIFPNSGKKGGAGVFITDAPGKTNFIGEGNLFTEMDNGFVADNSNFELSGSKFLNFRKNSDASIFSGYGVIAEKKRADINKNEFSDCWKGVKLEKAAASIIDNDFIACNDGIHSKRGGIIHILDNKISANKHAIRSDDDFILAVLNNAQIEVNGEEGEEENSYAVRIESPSGTFAAVSNNAIFADNSKKAFSMQSGSALTARKNTVVNNFSVGANGILSVGVNNINLYCNNVIGSGFHSRGIYDIDSKGKIECNKTIGAGTGINFTGGMFGVTLKGNSMLGNSNFGLSLRGGDIAIGEQPHYGNTWLGTGASHKGIDVDASKFTVHTSENGFLPNPPDPARWFELEPVDTWFECPDPGCGLNLNLPELPDFPDVEECEEFTELDRKIAGGTFETAGAREGNLWNAEKGLLEKIRIPCIGEPPVFPEIDVFGIGNENSELGQLVDIELGIQNLRMLSEENQLAIDNAQTNLDNELAIWRDLGGQLSDEELTESEVQNLTGQKVNSFALIQQLQTNLSNIEENVEQDRIQAAAQLLNQNNAIVTSSVPAANEKLVNEIYLQTLAVENDEFSSEQLTTLLSVASQCPQDGGDGVYRARALYAFSHPNYIFNDEECEPVDFRRNTSPTVRSIVDFILRPNPAKTEVELQFLNDAKFKGKVRIINLLGESIAEFDKEIDNKSLNLDVSKLDSGVYFVQVWSNGKVISSQKLSVIK